jgi:hypothetical protein
MGTLHTYAWFAVPGIAELPGSDDQGAKGSADSSGYFSGRSSQMIAGISELIQCNKARSCCVLLVKHQHGLSECWGQTVHDEVAGLTKCNLNISIRKLRTTTNTRTAYI